MSRQLKAVLTWRVAGDFAENVFYFTSSNDALNDWELSITLYNALIDQTSSPNEWISRLRLMSSEDAFLSTLSVRVINPNGGNRYANQFQSDTFPGLVNSPIYTGECAMVINWLSNTEPAKLGRNFFPAVPTSFVTSGRWEAAAQTAAANFMQQHIAGPTYGGETFLPIIWRQSDKTYRLVSDGYLSPNVGQQSRRGLGE